MLALNVAEAEGHELLAFDATGSYRLLLPAMSEGPGELERFYEETVAPLSAYDDQYETDLVNDDRGLSRQRRQRHPDGRRSCSPTATRSATASSG